MTNSLNFPVSAGQGKSTYGKILCKVKKVRMLNMNLSGNRGF